MREPMNQFRAAEIYETQRFHEMPILADALEDAGCDDPDILSHCREPGAHARGCWVLDLLLGGDEFGINLPRSQHLDYAGQT
jgi:hypothetical protein